jgi:hypothetical protein
VIIALLTVELHCYVLYLPEGLWGRLGTWEHSRACVASERTEVSLSRPAVCQWRLLQRCTWRAARDCPAGEQTVIGPHDDKSGHACHCRRIGCRGGQVRCAVAEAEW